MTLALLLLWFFLPILSFTFHTTPVYLHYFLAALPASFLLIALFIEAILTHWLPLAGGWLARKSKQLWVTKAVPLAALAICTLYLLGLWTGQIYSTLLLYNFNERNVLQTGEGISLGMYLTLFERARRYAMTGATVYYVTSDNETPVLDYLIRWQHSPLQVLKGQQYLVFPGQQGSAAYYIVPPERSQAATLLSQFSEHELSGERFPDPQGVRFFQVYRFTGFGQSEQERLAQFFPSPASTTPTRFSNGLTFTGLFLERQGNSLGFTSISRLDHVSAGQPSLSFSYAVVDDSGKPWSHWESLTYPSAYWQAGDTLINWAAGSLDGVPTGKYHLEVVLYRLTDGTLVPLSPLPGQPPADRVRLEPLRVPSPISRRQEVHPQHLLGLRFGDRLTLLGYDLQAPGASQSLHLLLYWQARGLITRDYTVFYHLFDARGRPVAQLDTQPVQGRYPTSFWQATEIVADPVMLTLSASLAAPCCTLNLGLYTLPEVRRLPITDPAGHSLGDSINISLPMKDTVR